MLTKIVDFLLYNIWRIRYTELPRWQRFLLRPLRVLVLAVRGFHEDHVGMRASALTIFSLLSIVPVLAVAFGIAKGFGLGESLERGVRERLQGQPEVVDRMIDFANTMLAEAKGGVVAGVGVIFLFWAVIRLLTNVESSFNHIWGVKSGRPFSRRIFDYLSIILLAPILLTTSSALTAGVSGLTSNLSFRFPVLDWITGLTAWVSSVVPFVMIVLLLTLMYMFLPNIRVSFKAGSLAAITAGILYQAAQRLYFYFQVELANYNAIYGTFAALPLFLIWLQLSWMVVLFGAEISFAIDNQATYALEHDCASVSNRFRRLLALRFTAIAARRFERGEPPVSATELSHELAVPVRLVREILFDLVEAGVLNEVNRRVHMREEFQPARAIETLTVQSVLKALDVAGKDTNMARPDRELARFADRLDEIDALIEASKGNVLVQELLTTSDIRQARVKGKG